MLKHILNGGSATANNAERSNVKSNALNGPRTLPSSTQSAYHAAQEAVNAELQSRLRPTNAEPEYQNTRMQSPSSEFYRNLQANKSVRSMENVCGGDAESGTQTYTKRVPDLHWNRTKSTGSGLSDTTVHYPRQHSRVSALNHSYAGTVGSHPFAGLSPQQRLNQTEVLNLSTNVVPANFTPIVNGPTTKVIANGGLHIPKSSPLTPSGSGDANQTPKTDSNTDISKDSGNANGASGDIFSNGVKEMLTSLGLLCLISLLLALLSLIFLLKISPVTAADVKDLLRAEQFTIISPDEYVTVYEVTLALCALSLSLNLCCLLVCSVQFLFAVKLAQSSVNGDRTNKYLQRSSVTRICAIAGFFISIPVFLTGVILYTFIQFHSTPAIITSVLIGSGIVFCGCAMVHNVFVWQREKTNAVKALMRRQKLHQQLESGKRSTSSKLDVVGTRNTSATALSTLSTLPAHVNADLSSVTSTPHELSTLV